MLSITGQRGISHKNTVIQPIHPIVTLEQLNDVSSDINQRELSGKQVGSCVLTKDGDDWVVYMATGWEKEAKWVPTGKVAEETAPVEPVEEIVCKSNYLKIEPIPATLAIVASGVNSVLLQTPIKDGTNKYYNTLNIRMSLTFSDEGTSGYFFIPVTDPKGIPVEGVMESISVMATDTTKGINAASAVVGSDEFVKRIRVQVERGSSREVYLTLQTTWLSQIKY